MPVLPTQLKVKLLREGAKVPTYAREGDSGADLRYCDEFARPDVAVCLLPGETHKFDTGLAFETPDGHEIQVRPRSSVSAAEVVCHFGTVDSSYRGEVKILLTNIGADPFTVRHGDRIAQMVLAEVPRAAFDVVRELSSTARGVGGFGSSGVK